MNEVNSGFGIDWKPTKNGSPSDSDVILQGPPENESSALVLGFFIGEKLSLLKFGTKKVQLLEEKELSL